MSLHPRDGGLLVFVLLLGLADPILAAPKTDVVELLNGDRITCEIRKLDRGKLTVKTDGIAGVRVNHMLNVMVDGFTVTRQ